MSIHFEWTHELSVGEATIDEQHQRLLAQLNAVIDAMALGSGSEKIPEALAFFERYVNEHLAYEEAYMLRRGYREIEEHKVQHQAFRDTYADFKQKFDSGLTPDKILIDMEVFLGEWWLEHIGHEDKKYYLELGVDTGKG
ncbi:MAG: hemerythrin family protein [Patescibacteria group bacterium]|nr:hemerythrin family protein [Patescibacteria group bacterium]MDE1966278.1 hemerythrin family protein [Patescibacteria group bacterium]